MTVQNSFGRVFGAILLVAGCSIGAGMLGIPVLSAMGGFFPSLLLFVICWLFMLSTAFLMLEVIIALPKEANILSMASHTLGTVGKASCWLLFSFLFYSLMVAYSAASGSVIVDFMSFFGLSLPLWVGSLSFALLFGLLIYLGTHVVDQFNRFLMVGLIVTYLIVVILGAKHIESKFLLHINWKASLLVIPTMIISFGYHNLIPSLSSYLSRDTKALRLAIILGSLIPLLVYLAWQMIILGQVPYTDFGTALDAGSTATQALKDSVGTSTVVVLAECFSFFAIVTSFLGVALSIVHFLSDGLKIKQKGYRKGVLCFLALAPPFFFSISYPGIFLTALNFAGAFGSAILFGVFPPLMVWSLRYSGNSKKVVSLLPGGKPVLVIIILFSLFVVCLECAQELGFIQLVGAE